MTERLRRVREERAAGDSGFTLIEMLVVVVIIGILAGISIPLYLNYRKGAENKSAESDVRGAIAAIEQFYVDNGNVYPDSQVGVASTNMVLNLAGGGATTQTVTVSPGNQLQYENNGATYVVCGFNSSGGQMYVYDSVGGKPVAKSGAATLQACVTAGNP